MATIAFVIAVAALAVALWVAWRQQTINSELAREIIALKQSAKSTPLTTNRPDQGQQGEGQESEASVTERPGQGRVLQAGETDGGQDTSPRTLYLSRADEHGVFTRATEAMMPGNSIFCLTPIDGDPQRGMFTVIDDRGVHAMALMMPTLNLAGACTGADIQVSGGATAIVTDAPGEAACSGGRWHVTVPATIHFVK